MPSCVLAARRARLAFDAAGIIGNGLHVYSQSVNRTVNVRRSAGPNKKAPPFGGTLSHSPEEMRCAKLSAPDRGAVVADQASGHRPAAADPASAGLGSAGAGSGSAGQDSGSDCSFQFSFLLRRGLTSSAKRGCARFAREHPVPLVFARRPPAATLAGGTCARATNSVQAGLG